jgi:hypothetical protein
MTLTDINADGDYKLVVSDLGTGTSNIKLKVWSQVYLLHFWNWFYKLKHKEETACKEQISMC